MATPSATPARAKVFISYKSDVQPDHDLAAQIFEAIRQQGHSVFIDRTMCVGQEWAREIEANVRGADYLIALLTAASSLSEMVKGDIEIARDQAATTPGTPRILPVRVAFAGKLPYPLNAWLDPLKCMLWRGTTETPQLIRALANAVSGAEG